MTVFIRVVEAGDKEAALRAAVADRGSPLRFNADTGSLGDIPRSPFAYWVSDSVRRLFLELPQLHKTPHAVWSTNPLNEDFRYARTWWEVASKLLGREWVPWAKGGAYSPIYFDVHTVINWSHKRQSYGSFIGTVNRPLTRPASVQHFFRPGLTWPRRTQGGLSLRAMPAGCIFADKGPGAFVEGDRTSRLLALLSVMNSSAFRGLVQLQMAFGSYEVGVLQRTPVPDLDSSDVNDLAQLARRTWSCKRDQDTVVETSHAFVLPALVRFQHATVKGSIEAYDSYLQEILREVASLLAEINDRCFGLYRIWDEDRSRMQNGIGTGDSLVEGEEDDIPTQSNVDHIASTASLISWAIGVAFGRYDVRLGTGERPLPAEPEPFDPLPPCSPGMLTGDDGFPLDAPPKDYKVDFSRDGVLVDDPGHARDITDRARQVFDLVFGEKADDCWQEAGGIVDARRRDLYGWLADSFFESHIKQYSMSRRKAPIYWQLATPSVNYSVWLYCHRFSRDTMYRVLNDYVAPKLAHEERKLTSLIHDQGPTPTAGQRKEREAQESFVSELSAFRDEVARVAPLWNPDLDDGVIINFAPLWRLVPQIRTWQRECKKVWDKLCKGDYDWAHLAMYLWPERVVPKCTDDRSLAIAHGLEDDLWFEDDDGKWSPRDLSEGEIAELVAARTSPSVKAALEDLLNAPAPIAGTKRRKAPKRKSRAASPSAETTSPRQSGARKTPRARRPTADEDTLEAIKRAIEAGDSGTSRAEVIAATGLTAAQWNSAIRVLLDRGDVVKTGERRGTRYFTNQRGGDDA